MNDTYTRPLKETRPASWRAINGHIMDGQEIRYYQDGEYSSWVSEGWSAQHSSDCQCETGGADMGDW